MNTKHEHEREWPVPVEPDQYDTDWREIFEAVFVDDTLRDWWEPGAPWPFAVSTWPRMPLARHPMHSRWPIFDDDPDTPAEPPELDPYAVWREVYAAIRNAGDDVWMCRCFRGWEELVAVPQALFPSVPLPPPEGYTFEHRLSGWPMLGFGRSGKWAFIGDFDQSAIFAAEPELMQTILDQVGGEKSLQDRLAYALIAVGSDRAIPKTWERFGWPQLDLDAFRKYLDSVCPPGDGE